MFTDKSLVAGKNVAIYDGVLSDKPFVAWHESLSPKPDAVTTKENVAFLWEKSMLARGSRGVLLTAIAKYRRGEPNWDKPGNNNPDSPANVDGMSPKKTSSKKYPATVEISADFKSAVFSMRDEQNVYTVEVAPCENGYKMSALVIPAFNGIVHNILADLKSAVLKSAETVDGKPVTSGFVCGESTGTTELIARMNESNRIDAKILECANSGKFDQIPVLAELKNNFKILPAGESRKNQFLAYVETLNPAKMADAQNAETVAHDVETRATETPANPGDVAKSTTDLIG